MSLAPLTSTEISDANVLFEDIFCNSPAAVIGIDLRERDQSRVSVVALCGKQDFALRHAQVRPDQFEELQHDRFSQLYRYRGSARDMLAGRDFCIGTGLNGGPQ